MHLMLRSFTILGPILVSLICENPRYTKMVPEEVLGKFGSHQIMVKDTKYIDDVTNGSTPTHRATKSLLSKQKNEKESLPSKGKQVEASDLNDEEMTLSIKRFKTAIKGVQELQRQQIKC
jgi:hypothetical protein